MSCVLVPAVMLSINISDPQIISCLFPCMGSAFLGFFFLNLFSADFDALAPPGFFKATGYNSAVFAVFILWMLTNLPGKMCHIHQRVGLFACVISPCYTPVM